MIIPKDDQRVVIVGRTGSGKTRAGMYHLSLRDLSAMPWIIFDFKRDDLVAAVNPIEIGLKDKRLPDKPGLYVVRPMPNQEKEVEEFLWKIWARGHVGLFFDEGYMIGDSEAFRAIQTQGRSKRIPTITLSQRPVWMSRFIFSEANFFIVFHLNDKRDRQTVGSFMPKIPEDKLPNFHSYYYCVDEDDLVVLSPVPSDDVIVSRLRPPPEEKKRLFVFA